MVDAGRGLESFLVHSGVATNCNDDVAPGRRLVQAQNVLEARPHERFLGRMEYIGNCVCSPCKGRRHHGDSLLSHRRLIRVPWCLVVITDYAAWQVQVQAKSAREYQLGWRGGV